jgi:hypothetical protein
MFVKSEPAQGRISPIYLAGAAAQALLITAWQGRRGRNDVGAPAPDTAAMMA